MGLFIAVRFVFLSCIKRLREEWNPSSEEPQKKQCTSTVECVGVERFLNGVPLLDADYWRGEGSGDSGKGARATLF